MPDNMLHFTNRYDFRKWLEENHNKEKECFIPLKKGCPKEDGNLYYLDAVEEALCFGWIDSAHKRIDGIDYQRFSPRLKKGLWTELNKERVRRLEYLGLMSEDGRKVLPKMGQRSFKMPLEVEKALKGARVYSKFKTFPDLYQRIRAYNVYFYYSWDKETYQKALNHLIEMTRAGKMYGEWNDYGRLLEYKKSQKNYNILEVDIMDFENAKNYWDIKDKDNVVMEKEDLESWLNEFLNSHNTLALATGTGDFIDNTPLEYNYVDNKIYIFTEGGHKFIGLEKNRNVAVTVFDTYAGFGKINSVQIFAKCEIIENKTEEYLNLLDFKHIPRAMAGKLSLYLLRLDYTQVKILCSDFKKNGYSNRQVINY